MANILPQTLSTTQKGLVFFIVSKFLWQCLGNQQAYFSSSGGVV